MKKEAKVLGRIDAGLLPCMPHILLKLLTLEIDGRSQNWLQAIEHDPALSARILSAWRTNNISSNDTPASIGHAITILGIESVQAIVHNAAIQQAFSPYNSHPTGDLNKYWWRTTLCANLAEQLAQHTAYPYPQEARLGAMLCALDPLAQWASAFKQKRASGTGRDESTLTQNDLKLSIAANLVLEWRLHPFLADAIRYHQEAYDQLQEAHPLVRIVHLASRLANYLTGAEPLPAAAGMLFFSIESQALNRLADAARQDTKEIAQLFNIGFEEEADTVPTPPPGERRIHRNFVAEKQLQLAESPVDARIKLDLAREVRDLALIDSLRNLLNQANGFNATLSQCADGAHLLFGLTPPLYFVADKTHHLQVYPRPGQDQRASELRFSAQDSPSLAAASLSKNLPLNSLSDHAGSILDQQVSQLLSSSGVLYLPFAANGSLAALAAFGIEPHQLPRLGKQRRLLSRFGLTCARALLAENSSKLRNAENLREQLSAQQFQIKRVAHEVNNPLSIMKNYLKLLSLKLNDEEARNDLRIFNDEIDRIASIIRSLANPAASPASINHNIDINSIIRDLIELSSDTLFSPAKITVNLDLTENLTLISTQRDKLKQILLNLLKNAVEAMPNGGASPSRRAIT